MMQNYCPPCYTLTETMDILGLRQSELHHAIRSNTLKAVLYTKTRNMLLFRRIEKDQWIGIATCTYRGHVFCHPSYITSLLDSPKILFEKGSFRLLDENGISNWSIAYPFIRPLPHSPIVDWQPIDQNAAIGRSRSIAEKEENWPIGQVRPIGQTNTPLYVCAATPLPSEYEPTIKMLNKWMEDYQATKKFEPLLGKAKNADIVELDFTSNSTFSFGDLRIPASEIEQYKAFIAESEKTQKLNAAVTSVINKTNNQRENQLHTLVNRILNQYPEIGAKDAWRIIEEDNDRDEKLFDTDLIIQAMDVDCIEWRSKYGKDQSITWTSFQPMLTKLKKRRNS